MMELRYWRGESKLGLPSVNIESLAALAYVKFTKAEVLLSPSNKTWLSNKAQILPSLQTSSGEIIHSNTEIYKYLRLKYYHIDGWLHDEDHMKMVALKAAIQEQLIPAIRSFYWLDSSNFTDISRGLFAERCSYPANFTFPQQQREKYEQIISLKRNIKEEEKSKIAEKLQKNGLEMLDLLEDYLGDKKDFLFGSRPTSADVMLFSGLALLLKLPLANCKLQNSLKGKNNLCRYTNRILVEYFTAKKESTDEPIHEDEADKYDWVLSVSVATVAMISYAVNIGLLQTTR